MICLQDMKNVSPSIPLFHACQEAAPSCRSNGRGTREVHSFFRSSTTFSSPSALSSLLKKQHRGKKQGQVKLTGWQVKPKAEYLPPPAGLRSW